MFFVGHLPFKHYIGKWDLRMQNVIYINSTYVKHIIYYCYY